MPEQQFIERPLTLDDAIELAKTLEAISAYLGIHSRYEPDTMQMEWSEPGMDISKSSLGIFTPDGQIVAYIVIWDNSDIPVRPWLNWDVHPDYLDYQLGEKLLQWADNRKDDLIRRCPPNTKIALHCGSVDGYEPVEQTAYAAGYKKIRISYKMQIDMDSKPPTPNFPDNIKIRNYVHEDDLEAFVEVFRNSFSDHFGYVEEPFEKELEEFRHWFNTDKHFDPKYVFLAIDKDTDRVAGYILGLKEEHGHPDASHIELVGVHRDYRRRGIAKAMLYHAFNIFWENDRKRVTLGVDGESLTNAVKLYEQVGMHISRQYARYEKVLRDGEELATVELKA